MFKTRPNRAISATLRLTAALAVLAAWLASPSGVAQAQQMTQLRVAYIPVITWLPALVAKEEGIFEKNGLDVTFTKFPNLINLPGTLGKQFDLAPSTAPDLLNAVASGLNIAAVAGETLETSANKSYQVIVKADSGINSVKDLAGKRVAGPGVGSVMHVALLYWVAKEGADPSTVVGLEAPFTAMLDQLKSGRVDAVEPLEPFVGQMLGQGFKSIGDPLLAVADPVLFPFWIADADWARAHGDVLKALGRLARRRAAGDPERRSQGAESAGELFGSARRRRRPHPAAALRLQNHAGRARRLAQRDGVARRAFEGPRHQAHRRRAAMSEVL